MILYLIQILVIIILDTIVFILFSAALGENVARANTVQIDLPRSLLAFGAPAIALLVQFSILQFYKKRKYLAGFFSWLKNGAARPAGWKLWAFSALPILVISLYYASAYSWSWRGIEAQTLLFYAMFFFGRSLYEEVIFRGYFLRLASKKKSWREGGVLKLIFAQAIVFAGLHSLNPDFEVIRIVNIFLAGVALGALAWVNFPLAVIFHFLWNFVQAIVFGLDVSGYHFDESFYEAPQHLASWEDSPIGLGALALFTALLLNKVWHDQRAKQKWAP